MKKSILSPKIFRLFCGMGIVAILASAVGALLAWQMNKTLYQDGFETNRENEWPYLHGIRGGDQQGGYDRKLAEVLERYPGLQPEWKTVLDENNGFLQLFSFYEYITGANGLTVVHEVELSEDLRKELSGSISEAEFADGKRFCSLISELERIAGLTETSCAGIAPHRLLYYPSNPLENFTRILLYDAKLAAKRGDKETALSRVKTAVRIGMHFSQVETQTLAGISISVSSESFIMETALSDLLPELSLNENEYKVWRKALTEGRVEIKPEQISIGEFNVVTSALSVPTVEKVWLFHLTGQDQIYDAIAECHIELIRLSSGDYRSCLETWKLSKALADKVMQTPYLSRSYLRILNAGLPTYVRTVTRASARFRYYDAALAVLAGEEVPMELITGKPFVFDAVNMTLLLPDDPVLRSLEFSAIELAFAQ